MKKGKIIVIEGTDCSGKNTQSKLLAERLNEKNINTKIFSFPMYQTATGKIVGGPILGKSYIGDGFFSEGSSKLDPKVFSLYLAADRKYNIDIINNLIEQGDIIILDRYVYSNMAFQGAKYKNKEEKLELFKWIEKLEFELLELPKSDINIFLHMPVVKTLELFKNREEDLDQNEKDTDYLKETEKTYFLLTEKYDFKTIECINNVNIRSVEEINDELFNFVLDKLKI